MPLVRAAMAVVPGATRRGRRWMERANANGSSSGSNSKGGAHYLGQKEVVYASFILEQWWKWFVALASGEEPYWIMKQEEIGSLQVVDSSERKLAKLGGDALQCLWDQLQVLQPQNLAPPTLLFLSFKVTAMCRATRFIVRQPMRAATMQGLLVGCGRRCMLLRVFAQSVCQLALFRQMQRLSCQIPVILMETCCPIIVAPTDCAGKNQNARGSVFEVPCGKWSRFVGTCSTTTSYTKSASTGEFLFR